jgi:hypothetical protein
MRWTLSEEDSEACDLLDIDVESLDPLFQLIWRRTTLIKVAVMSNSVDGKTGRSSGLTKVCPYCSTHLLLQATACSYCKKKVGPVNKQGIAQKPTDWKAYTVCFLTWGALFGYFWILGWSKPMTHFFKKLAIATWFIIVKVSLAIWNVFVTSWDRIVEIWTQLIDNLMK